VSVSGSPAPVHPVLYLIRHGETDWNAEGRLQGGRDIPLNDYGRVQAEEAAARLRALCPRFDDLDYVSSPMTRTRETMEILRRSLGLHERYYRIEEALREITFGTWEGSTWHEVLKNDHDRARAREQDKWNYVPPAGESYAMLCVRIQPWHDALTRDTVAVAHGGVARALMALSGAVDPATAAMADIHQGKVLVFEAGGMRWA
jgi:broad specificity phosphatase PhoE